MLGTTAYLGIDFAIKGFVNSVDYVLNTYNYEDVEIRYPYGLDDQYIKYLNKQDDVSLVDGEYSTNQYFKHDNSSIQAKVTSLTKFVNVVNVIEGNLPKTNKECAIEDFYAKNHNIKIGDTIKFIHDDNDNKAYQLKAIIDNDFDKLKQDKKEDPDGMAYLTNDTYTITALIDCPDHLGKYEVNLGYSEKETPLNVVIYVTADAFDKETITGYTKVFAKSNSLQKLNNSSDEYKNESEEFINKIKDVSSNYINNRNKEIVDNKENIRKQIYQEIVDGDKEVSDAKRKIADGEVEIQDAELQIKDGESQIEEGKIELAEAKKELRKAELQVEDGWNDYYKGLDEYNTSKKTMDVLQRVYDVTDEILNVCKSICNSSSILIEKKSELEKTYKLLKFLLNDIDTDSYFVVDVLNDFFEELNNNPEYRETIGNYEKIFDLFVEKYGQDFPTRDEVNEEIDALLTSLAEEEDKQKLVQVKTAINDFYDEIETVIELPSNLLMMYDMLKAFGMLEGIEQSIINEINTKLTDENIPTLGNILSTIDTVVQTIYPTTEAKINAFVEVMDKLKQYLDIVQNAMHQYVLPLLNDGWTQLANANKELEDGYNTLMSAKEEIDDGWYEYNSSLKLIQEKEIELANGKKDLEKAKIDLIDAKNKLKDGELELVEGKKAYQDYLDATKDIKEYDAAFVGRESNFSILGVGIVKDIINKLKYTMAVLFVVVGIFVSYSSMSRLVHDQTIEIGTKKALGLRQSEITLSFILYAFFATIIGSLLAILFSRYIIEPLIVYVLADSFNIHEFFYYFGIKEYLVFTMFELLVTMTAAYFASHKVLKQKAKDLLSGTKEIIGKQRFYQKGIIWNKLSLLTKTIINNCFNDTRRVFGTIVGIAGCASLLVCAISFKNNVDISLYRQINELTAYDTVVYINKENDKAESNITKQLQKANIEYTGNLCRPGLIRAEDGNIIGGTIYTSNSDELFDYFRLVSNGKNIKPTNGIIVSKSYSDFYGVGKGEDIVFIDSLGKEHTFIIDAVTDYHVIETAIFMNSETYEKEFKEEITNNVLLLRRGNKSLDEVSQLICNCDGFLSIKDYDNSYLEDSRAITSTAYIIFAVFLVLSTSLAFLVILNLLVMFVDEKKKEVIVLMINGYKKKYAKKYIYTDTIFLTIIGIIIGSIFGSIVGIYTTRSMNTASSIIATVFLPKTYILAALITGVLCLITSLIALRKIDKYKLTEINSK